MSAMPEATERPHQPALTSDAMQALAADFEVALEALRPFFYGSGSDDDADAATARVDEIVRKIVALPTTDIKMMRLKARIYLWSEATDFEAFAAKNEGDGSSEAVLVSLFAILASTICSARAASILGHRPARRSGHPRGGRRGSARCDRPPPPCSARPGRAGGGRSRTRSCRSGRTATGRT